ncbi:hypothetical protein NDU88_001969 [Pleurodeles waltl]|uniref:Uncharacterized protein n=1 Tax=Pleurodeles waltl TaxID=8319 RepID=A0AAV7SAI3_PLEWA|nr:hypothetical protein NDU88_001969 [Pleurodeles waltl]
MSRSRPQKFKAVQSVQPVVVMDDDDLDDDGNGDGRDECSQPAAHAWPLVSRGVCSLLRVLLPFTCCPFGSMTLQAYAAGPVRAGCTHHCVLRSLFPPATRGPKGGSPTDAASLHPLLYSGGPGLSRRQGSGAPQTARGVAGFHVWVHAPRRSPRLGASQGPDPGRRSPPREEGRSQSAIQAPGSPLLTPRSRLRVSQWPHGLRCRSRCLFAASRGLAPHSRARLQGRAPGPTVAVLASPR